MPHHLNDSTALIVDNSSSSQGAMDSDSAVSCCAATPDGLDAAIQLIQACNKTYNNCPSKPERRTRLSLLHSIIINTYPSFPQLSFSIYPKATRSLITGYGYPFSYGVRSTAVSISSVCYENETPLRPLDDALIQLVCGAGEKASGPQ